MDSSTGLLPDQAELAALVEHVAFEVAALEATSQRFQASGDRFSLEAFLVHARVLRSFFWDRWEADDRYASSALLAEHYFEDPQTWRGIKELRSPVLREMKPAIDKQLAHITRERADPMFFQNLEEQVGPLRSELLALWDHFLKNITADWRAQFRLAFAAKREELGLS